MLKRILIVIIPFFLLASGSLEAFELLGSKARQELKEAEQLAEQGEIDQAISAYEEFLKARPRSRYQARVWLELGKLYYEKGEYEKSIRYLEAVLEKSRKKSLRREANYFLARSYFQKERYQDVIAVLSGLYERMKEPEQRKEISRLFFYSYLKLEQYPKAVLWLGRYGEYAPAEEVEQIRGLLPDLLSRMTIEELKKVIDSSGPNWVRSEAVWELANRYYQDSEFQKAKERLEGLLRHFPNSQHRQEAGQLLELCERLLEVEPDTIGLLLPLSGTYQYFGERALKGALLAGGVFESPELAPRVRLRVVDSSLYESKIEQAVKELILEDHIIALVGPILGQRAKVSAQLTEKYGVPMIALSPKEGLADTGTYIFQDCLTKSAQVKALLDWAMGQEGLKKFAVLYPDDKYGSEFAQLFTEEVTQRGGEVVKSFSYPAEATDIGENILQLLPEEWIKLKAEHPEEAEEKEPELEFEALFLPDSWEKIALIVPQLLFHQVSIQLLGTSSWHSEKIFEYCRKEYLESAVFVDLYAPEINSREFEDYQFYFRQQYQEEPTLVDMQAYEVVALLISILERNQVKNRRELAEMLLQIQGWKSPLGKVSVSPQGEFLHKLHIFRIEKGKFQIIH